MGTATVSANQTYHPSAAFTPSTVGDYLWSASYGGDPNNAAASRCGAGMVETAMSAANGSGALTTPTSSVSASSTGHTIAFTYTAATGGISGGTLRLAVPHGWSAPSTTATAAGYTTASAGSLTASGQTITISGINLPAGQTVTITYGSKTGGGPGATAPATPSTQTWQAMQKSIATGTLTNLASSPQITIT